MSATFSLEQHNLQVMMMCQPMCAAAVTINHVIAGTYTATQRLGYFDLNTAKKKKAFSIMKSDRTLPAKLKTC